MDSPSHLVCFFCITSGQNEENLGIDEEQIISIVFLLYDVTKKRAEMTQRYFVRPEMEGSLAEDPILTEECKIQTGILEQDIRAAEPLARIIDKVEGIFSSLEIRPQGTSSVSAGASGSPCFCTDGQLHLRSCLLPEVCWKGIQLPPQFRTFFDLRKEFQNFYKMEKPIHGLQDIMNFLGLKSNESPEFGVRQCHDMASIIQRLITDGHVFRTPEVIHDALEPGISNKDDVDDDTVVRARGLPWQSSDQDIAGFFTGLNIARGGVLLCLSEKGRRNGEALVRFETREHRDLALRRHRHHLGHRYIEVYRATNLDFKEVDGESHCTGHEFLSRRIGKGGQVIVRMRGLPYSCSAQQVLEFFQSGMPSVDVFDGENGILFVHQWDGRVTGEAFALFGSEEEARRALTKHKRCIGTRYIELFKSTSAEVQQVLKRSLDPRTSLTEDIPDETTHHERQSPGLPPCQVVRPLPAASSAQTASGPRTLPPPTPHSNSPAVCHSGSRRDCIRIRGLPYDVSVSEILTFLGGFSRHIIFHGIHLIYDSLGRPIGEAFIQMDSESLAELTAKFRSGRPFRLQMSHNSVEVLQCSVEDMSTELAPPSLFHPIATLTIAPAAASAGVVLMPWAHSQQIQYMISPSHSQLINPGSAPVLGGFGGSKRGYSSCAIKMTPEIRAVIAPMLTNNTLMLTQIPVVHPVTMATALQPLTAATTNPPMTCWCSGSLLSFQNASNCHTYPNTIVMTGLSLKTQLHDIIQFLEGFYEATPPEVQLTTGRDGRMSEALVTFHSRLEAEKAVKELNCKIFGGNPIELFML